MTYVKLVCPSWVWFFILMGSVISHVLSPGTAITLLHKEEAHHFKELIRKTGREKIAKFRVKDDELHPLIPGYQDSLTRLQDVLAQEHQKQKQPREKAQVLKYLQQQIKDNLISTGKDLQWSASSFNKKSWASDWVSNQREHGVDWD